ncbi:MAG: DUF5671 domain-containing protein [Chloroflexia bacterium]
MNDPRRLFRYVLAFAGLLTTLYAVTGLIGVAVTTFALSNNVFTGSDDARIRASLYLAELIFGLPVWLVSWSLSTPCGRLGRGAELARASPLPWSGLRSRLDCRNVRVKRSPELLPHPAQHGENGRTVRDAIFSASRVLVFGVAWWYHARIGRSERGLQEVDRAHDLGVYLLAGFSLAMLASGLVQAFGQGLRGLVDYLQPGLVVGPVRSVWARWGDIVAQILAGGLVWGAVWRYDLARGGTRRLRVVFLYIVLI